MQTEDRPVERLLAMFATDRRKTRDGAARKRNNGATQFSQLSGIDLPTISRWRHGAPDRSYVAGEVPPAFNDRVLMACDRAGIPRDALVGILKPVMCSTCGREIRGVDA